MSFIKKFLAWFFPPLGVVNDSRQTEHDWQLHVSYLGNLSITGNISTVDFTFPLGVNVVDVLQLEIDGDGIGTVHGAITRYHEAPDTLRFIVHHYTILIDREKLLDIASC